MSAVAKAADPRGLKRVCSSCGIRFYDLNKRPIACPNCSTEFTGEIKVKTRRSRLPVDDAIEAKARKIPNEIDDDADELASDADVISLDDLEEDAGDDAEDAADADLELDDEDLEVLDEDLEDLEEIEADGDIEIDEEDKD